MEQKIGWIGLGHMGIPMAQNLIKGGFDVTVYNRTPEKANVFAESGAKIASSVNDLCCGSDIIFTMLSDDASVENVYKQLLEVDVAGKLFINMSTISPDLAVQLAQKCTNKNAHYLDAPVSGSVKPASDGTLLVLVGGENADYEKAVPLFEKLGKLSLLLGKAGQGSQAKLAINYYMSVVISGLAETMLFAEKQGVDKEAMMLIVNESACGSPMSKMKTPSILQDNFPAAFPLKYMLKDVRLAQKEGLNSKLSESIEEAYKKAADQGLGDNDLMAVIKAMSI